MHNANGHSHKPQCALLQRGEARDTHSAEAMLQSIYGPSVRTDFIEQSGDFKLRFASMQIGALRIVRADVRGRFTCSRTIDGGLQLFVPFSGWIRQISPRDHVVLANPNVGCVVRPGESTTHTATSGGAFVLTVPMQRLAGCLDPATGHELGAAEANDLPREVRLYDPVVNALSRCIISAFSEVARLDVAGLGHVAAPHFEGLLLSLVGPALLRTHERSSARDVGAGATQMTNVRDYISAHAADPIDLKTLARQANIGMRALQIGFQKRFGMSPRDFILDCRLNNVRVKLLASDGVDTVTRIAIECGFGNMSHFASKYLDKFGELPSETLRHSRLAA